MLTPRTRRLPLPALLLTAALSGAAALSPDTALAAAVRGEPNALIIAQASATTAPAGSGSEGIGADSRLPGLPDDDALPADADSIMRTPRFRQLAHELRCLVCQNQTLLDSHAPLAQDLRNEVIRLMASGRDDEQIKQYLVDRYGEFVLYRPSWSWQNALLWLGPALMLLAALIVGWRFARQGRTPAGRPTGGQTVPERTAAFAAAPTDAAPGQAPRSSALSPAASPVPGSPAVQTNEAEGRPRSPDSTPGHAALAEVDALLADEPPASPPGRQPG